MQHAVYLAAENATLPGGKVGGVGDVIRDLPVAIANKGWQVTVITPAYGVFAKLAGATEIAVVDVNFSGRQYDVGVYEIPSQSKNVTTLVLDHERFVPTDPGVIYHSDPDGHPFATDATKFAFFCAAAASWIANQAQQPTVVHLHDWHSAFYLLLRDSEAKYKSLQSIRTVFTIHNLSYQGQRPLNDGESSLEQWFPDLDYRKESVVDPVSKDCINPMAMAIRRADCVNTVSPSYAREILEPSDAATGFIGSEGLSVELAAAKTEGRLRGILNGCVYDAAKRQRPGWQQLVSAARATLERWRDEGADIASHELALQRLSLLPKRAPAMLLSSVGRIVDQKVSLLLQKTTDGPAALDAILKRIHPSGVVFLLGSGEPLLEHELHVIACRNPNFVFLRGYSEELGELLYQRGNAFLMPSRFEPCGISQMLAMRAGQPCVVHGVGGLRDTVKHDVTGFVFNGGSAVEQADEFVACVDRAFRLRHDDPVAWDRMCKRAAKERFTWQSSAERYIESMYEHD